MKKFIELCKCAVLYFNLTLSPTEQHLLQAAQWRPSRCFPFGRGLFACSLPWSAWPFLPFFSSHFFFSSFFFSLLLSERTLDLTACSLCRDVPLSTFGVGRAFSARLAFCLRVFSLGGNPLSSVSLSASLVNYGEGALGSTLSPVWVPHWLLHKPTTGSLPLSWGLGWKAARG